MSKHPGGAFLLEEFLMESLPISSLEGVGAPQKKEKQNSQNEFMSSCLLVYLCPNQMEDCIISHLVESIHA